MHKPIPDTSATLYRKQPASQAAAGMRHAAEPAILEADARKTPAA